MTMPLPIRSVPSSGAVNASSGTTARSCTTASRARSRSKRQSSGLGRSSAGKAQFCSLAMDRFYWVRLQAQAAGGVEKMRVLRVRRERDPIAGGGRRAAVGRDGEGLAADLHHQLGLGAHRLDHHGFRGDPAAQIEIDGADGIFYTFALAGLSVA